MGASTVRVAPEVAVDAAIGVELGGVAIAVTVALETTT